MVNFSVSNFNQRQEKETRGPLAASLTWETRSNKQEAHGPHRLPERPVQISEVMITSIYIL